MLRSSIFGSLLVLSLASLPATAGTLCQTRAVPSAATNWNSSLSFQKFDTTLGALTSISVKLTGTVAGAVLLESTDNAATLISTTYQVILTVQRPDFSPLVTVTPGTNFVDNLGPYDNVLDFGGTSGTQHLGIALSQNLTVTVPPPASDLALFTGAGTIALPVSAVANSTAVGAGNLVTQFITAAGATVELCYEYAPDCNQNGIPDAVDISTGTSLDVNQNGTPDECDPPTTGTEGCSHGYWKKHPAAWAATGYSPNMSFNTVFGVTAFTPDRTLIVALNTGGGGMNNLGRQATAALLSAAHPGVDFPLTPAQVISLTAQSVIDGTFATQASAFDVLVNLGCPLN
jgi:hypothetical protein